MVLMQPGHGIGDLKRPLLDEVLTEVAEVFDEFAVAAADQRDAVRRGAAARAGDSDRFVLIGAETDREKSEVEVGVADAQLVDDVLREDVRLAPSNGVALVLRSSGAESSLISRNAARIAE